MKYLREFADVSIANAAGTSGLESPHVSIVDGLSAVNFAKTSTEKFTCSFDSSGNIQSVTPVVPLHNVGDICYWDGSKLAYVSYTSWSSSLGTALAVCVIPTSHASVWGDGKARFMSIKGVNADGTAASTDQTLKWDGNSADAGLTKYTKVPTWDNVIGGSVGSDSAGYISSDKFTGKTVNVIDTTTQYYSTSYMIPSPYAADGSFYSDYIRTISGYNNALSDFNGKSNTATIVSILGSDGGQAAKACSLYSTSGIAAGEWYLPACGELDYIMPRFTVINSALTAVSGVLLDVSYYYWSSTEVGKNFAYYVRTYNGDVNIGGKGSSYYVRPFASLS